MKSSAFVATLTSLLLTSSHGFDAETELAIDDVVENTFMINNRVPGIGLSLVHDGNVLMSKGYGMRNISAGLAFNENTLFAIGSLTKNFLAVIIVKTLNEMYPQLDAAVLDVPIAELIPTTVNFTLSDRFRAEHTTFRDILSHRTGLENGWFDLIFGSIGSGSEFAYRSRYITQARGFRDGYLNNDNMYALAGEIIAAIAETTISQLLMSFVRDLEMVNTTLIDVDGYYESLPDMSQPYTIVDGALIESDIVQIRKIHVALGSGGLLSTSNDMAKYLNFHLNLGRVGSRQIVPENVMNWLYVISTRRNFQGHRQDTVNSILSGDFAFAVGLIVSFYDGWIVMRHGGFLAPYRCSLRIYRATKIGISMCTNGPDIIRNFPVLDVLSDSIFELVRGINETLAQILYSRSHIGESFVEHQLEKDHKTNRDPTVLHQHQIRTRVQLEEVVGLYGHPIDGVLTIAYEPETGNTTLQINISKFAYGRLHEVPGFPTTYSVEWKTNIIQRFYADTRSPVPSFWVDFGIADTILFRTGTFAQHTELAFVKDATLDTFPSIPWAPTSCGPE